MIGHECEKKGQSILYKIKKKNLKWMINLHIRAKAVTLLEVSIEKY